jgi:hypothetical protein
MPQDKTLDREMGQYLIWAADTAKEDSSLKNPEGLLLFYFSLYKLFQSESVATLLNGFIPRRKNSRGMWERTVPTQYEHLVEKNAEYRSDTSFLKDVFLSYRGRTRSCVKAVARETPPPCRQRRAEYKGLPFLLLASSTIPFRMGRSTVTASSTSGLIASFR